MDTELESGGSPAGRIPTFLYEALPAIYLLAGIGALFVPSFSFKFVAGIVLIGAGALIANWRLQSRKLRNAPRALTPARDSYEANLATEVSNLQSWPTAACRPHQ